MCESNRSAEQVYNSSDELAHEEGSVVLGNAISRVVCAMSADVKQNLLEQLIGDMIANGGDTSTLEQFQRVERLLPSQWPYKPDPTAVRAVLCAASAACGMTIGLGPDDNQVVALAAATLRGRTYTKLIV